MNRGYVVIFVCIFNIIISEKCVFCDSVSGDHSDVLGNYGTAELKSSKNKTSENGSPSSNCSNPDHIYACRSQLCPKTCDDYFKFGSAWKLFLKHFSSTAECIEGCYCHLGHYEDPTGKCVPEEECIMRCTDPNSEMVSCPDPCPVTCDNLIREKQPCKQKCPPKGCVCKPNYVLDTKTGKCVTPGHCDIVCPKSNEIFYACMDPCKPTCESILTDNPLNGCNPNSTSGTTPLPESCTFGCDCVPGYARNNVNDCVPINSCELPLCDDENAVMKPCGDPCPITCDSLDHEGPLNCTETCIVKGCACMDEFVLDANGKCVPPIQCPCKKKNEIRTPCGDFCPITCDNVNRKPKICPQLCISDGCTCKPGFVRNSEGECVSPSKCPPPPCEDLNAIRKPCGDPCPLTCDNLDNPPSNCTEQCIVNGCVCRDGYVLGPEGKCVRAISCPCKGAHQKRMLCGDYCPVTCDNKDKPRRCSLVCYTNGCACISGYVRNQYGECILPEQCAPACVDENAVRLPCGDPCGELTCDNMDKTPRRCLKICFKNACVCREGFVKDSNGKCIKPINCPCKGENKRRTACGDFCPVTCKNRRDFDLKDCPQVCYPNGCTCKMGYVRNQNKECVIPNKCPRRGIALGNSNGVKTG